MMVVRLLNSLLPFRPRPLHHPDLAFVLPHGMGAAYLRDETSFPSDHAALFVSLAVVTLCCSRRWGAIALVHALVMVSLPRVYLGLHYPTDILGGALLGILTVGVVMLLTRGSNLAKSVALWSDRYPRLFYPVFFLLSLQIATTFWSALPFLNILYDLVRDVLGR